MRSHLLFVASSILAFAWAAPLDAATVAREKLGDNTQISYHGAIAVGPDGVVHRVYADSDGVLMHAWGSMGAWQTEVIDTRESVLGEDNLAVDAEGRVHVAYYWNNREDSSKPRFAVVYAVRGSEGWERTTLANSDVLSGTALAVGPDGHARVGWPAYYDLENRRFGPAVIATFDGEGWNAEDLPVDGTPRDLRVDAAGRSHVLVQVTGGDTLYLTDASGSWAEESLPATLDLARLALDGDGRVHLAGYVSAAGMSQALLHFVHGSSGWEADGSLGDTGGAYLRTYPHLVAGPGRKVFILFDEQLQETWDGNSARWLYAFDGDVWERQVFATREDSAEIQAAAGAPDGTLHVLCGGREASRVDYFHIGGETLDLDASDLRMRRVKKGIAVRGRVHIRNFAGVRLDGGIVRLARADAGTLGPGTPLPGHGRRLRRLRPGAGRTVRISAIVRDAAPGDRLLLMVEFPGREGVSARTAALGTVSLGE